MPSWMFRKAVIPTAFFLGAFSAVNRAAGQVLNPKLEALVSEYYGRAKNIRATIEGDIAREIGIRQAALESSRKVYQYIREHPNDPDIDQAWFQLFVLDMTAADQKVSSEHLRACVAKFPKGKEGFPASLAENVNRSATRLLAHQVIARARSTSEFKAEVQRFDKKFPRAFLDRGDLRVAAAERALELKDVNAAEKFYDEAIALPMIESEINLEQQEKWSGWHAAWQRQRARLELCQRSFDDFGGDDLEGKPVKISDFRGKVVLISIWCLCERCRKGHLPDCRALYAEFRARGLEILGVALLESPEEASKAVSEWHLVWRHFVYGSSYENQYAAFRTAGTPDTILIDAFGKVRYFGLQGMKLEEKVRELIAEIPRSRAR